MTSPTKPAHYTPGGALCSLSSGLLNSARNYTFNSRLQPQHFHITSIPWGGNGAPTPCTSPTWTAGWLDLTYTYVDASGHNNGNLYFVNDKTDGAKSQYYYYDSLNRLASAQTYGVHSGNPLECWAETYTYDPWGNLYQFSANTTTQSAYIGCSQESGLSTAANTKNQLTSYNYDSAGNVISIPSIATYTYNAENQLTSTAGVTYTYDGDGKRVMKSSGTLYWYGTNSGPLMETALNGTANYVYYFFNGQIINRREFQHSGNVVDTYVLDQLGSTSIVSGYSGAWDQSTYYPFGGERVYAGNVGNHYKFTGKERDLESGLDNFGARYFGSSMGRFMSPDRMNLSEDRVLQPSNMLNKYVYAANNPLKYIDPDGKDVTVLFYPPHEVFPGHIMYFANNPSTGQSAFMSYGPVDTSTGSRAFQVLNGPVSGTSTFEIPKSADELRQTYTALTIQTTPEQAQEVINLINQISTEGDKWWRLSGPNCATVCRDALKAIGILPKDFGSISPEGLWDALFQKYADPSKRSYITGPHGLQIPVVSHRQGVDYGFPRYGWDPFDFIMKTLRPRACTTIQGPNGPETNCVD